MTQQERKALRDLARRNPVLAKKLVAGILPRRKAKFDNDDILKQAAVVLTHEMLKQFADDIDEDLIEETVIESLNGFDKSGDLDELIIRDGADDRHNVKLIVRTMRNRIQRELENL